MRRWGVLFLAAAGLAGGPAMADTAAGRQAFLSRDYATAEREWRSAAEAGDASAMMEIGNLYDIGSGPAQDFATALYWYRRAAEAGSYQGMFNVGAMYDNGRGVPVDRVAAIAWYKLAAGHGDGRAAYALGVIFRDGDGVPRDLAEAARQFRRAASAGIPAARASLVALKAMPAAARAAKAPVQSQPGTPEAEHRPEDMVILQRGMLARAPLDTSETRLLASIVPTLEAQAAHGDSVAQYALGYAYQKAVGTPADGVKSYVLYLQAAVSPDEMVQAAARQGAAEVGAGLTDAEHEAARSLLLNSTH